MNDKPTTCDDRAESISLLVAEALPAAEEQELRQHLLSCEHCRSRFEQAARVGDALRLAQRSQTDFDLPGIVARTMAQIASESAPQVSLPEARHASPAVAKPRTRRWQLVALVVAGCVVAVAVVGRSLWRTVPGSNVGELTIPQVEPATQLPIKAGSDAPTLIELRRAAAVSDEALDRLLAQGSTDLAAELFSSQSLWQESLQ